MTEEKKPGGEVLGELRELGQQLSSAFMSLWESEDSRKLRTEIEQGFLEIGQQVETAVKSARDSDAAKQFSEQVKETMDKARESEIAAKLEDGLVTGLRELNQQLSAAVSSLEADASSEAKPEGEETEDSAGA